MKKTIALIVSTIIALTMSANLTAFAGESKEIIVFAAASAITASARIFCSSFVSLTFIGGFSMPAMEEAYMMGRDI